MGLFTQFQGIFLIWKQGWRSRRQASVWRLSLRPNLALVSVLFSAAHVLVSELVSKILVRDGSLKDRGRPRETRPNFDGLGLGCPWLSLGLGGPGLDYNPVWKSETDSIEHGYLINLIQKDVLACNMHCKTRLLLRLTIHEISPQAFILCTTNREISAIKPKYLMPNLQTY